ncbi:MAG: hypothetical protein K0R65_2731 [Crocinitomicaceae bacterium]|jgi:hypothetical protein|nr:hypothetical protein [Crocinitomicaceae bacterium]
MKKILLLLAVLFTGFSYAEKGELVPPFTVVKDVFDVNIPEGYYVLQGTIVGYPSKKPVYGVTLESDPKIKPVTLKGNKFEITVKLEEDDVEFAKAGYHSSYFEEYKLVDRHRITIKVYLEKMDEKYLRPAEKPVIYGYSDEDLELAVTLDAHGELHFTYPQLPENKTWKMKLENDRFVDANGIEYPYLFWDSKMKDVHVQYGPGGIPGTVLGKKEILPYLEASLTRLGLNATEKTDFITYWGPRLTEKNYAFIQFQVQESCGQFADYVIEPKPDHFNRVYLVFSGYDRFPEYIETSPQELKAFERSGFHLLEWGGVELDGLPYQRMTLND